MSTIFSENKKLLALWVVTVFVMCFIGIVFATLASKKTTAKSLTFEYPEHWSSDYSEDFASYDAIVEGYVEETFGTELNFATVSNSVTSYTANSNHRTQSDVNMITADSKDVWLAVTNGRWSQRPNTTYTENAAELAELREENMDTITVNCWYWANPSDTTDFSKTTVTKTFAVNCAVKDIFQHCFEDIYADPTQPVLNIADKGMGTWVLRGVNGVSSNKFSTHALGVAIDINPSTGSYKINGVWYGNGYGHKKMTYGMWSELPETHTKYHVLYEDCPIVQIFKSYGFIWGGDWSTCDAMHFSFVGDGSNSRTVGINNYNKYK